MTEAARSSQRPYTAFSAGLVGWTLDAFDFFVVVFLFSSLQAQFGVSKAAIATSLAVTLAFRPVGAFLFGLLADRYGRRKPLIANVLFFTAIEILCGFAPSFRVFLLLRALFGIGMGGEWGVGAALAMEAAPRRRRGLLSGLLQAGYSLGYLFAALAARYVLPAWGWRSLFWLGALPALILVGLALRVPESDAWRRQPAPGVRSLLATLARFARPAAYLIVLMALMNAFSHGTQDLYPDFLAEVHHVAAAAVAWLAVAYNLGAIAGAFTFGSISERLGRRRTMLAAFALSLVVLPFWAFGATVPALVVAAVLMQFGVQGAWGIIPAHLNELAPDAVRGLLPGFAYQLGILIAAGTPRLEYALRDRFGYARAMTWFELGVIVALAIVVSFGPEARGKEF